MSTLICTYVTYIKLLRDGTWSKCVRKVFESHSQIINYWSFGIVGRVDHHRPIVRLKNKFFLQIGPLIQSLIFGA